MRRSIAGAAACCFGFASAAALADGYGGEYPSPYAAVPPYESVFSWTGFYAGGHFGFTYSDTRFDYAATPLATCTAITGLSDDCHTSGNTNTNSLAGGSQAGFNQQIGHFIWGLEGDVTWHGNDTGKATFLPAFGVVQNFSESDDWLITLRPRVGFAYYRAFIYATGGVAWSSVGHTVSFRDPTNVLAPLSAHESSTQTGWTLGTGVEYAIAAHVTLKGEYLFVDLGDVTVPTPAQGGWWPTTTRFSEQEHILRMGLNYKF